MTDLEQLTEAIFEAAMADYDMKISFEEDPEARAMLAYHRDAADAGPRLRRPRGTQGALRLRPGGDTLMDEVLSPPGRVPCRAREERAGGRSEAYAESARYGQGGCHLKRTGAASTKQRPHARGGR